MSSLVLASRSRARARLLADAGVSFTIKPPDIDEAALKQREIGCGATPSEVAATLALVKAQAAVATGEGGMILGADQTLDLAGALFDKPVDLNDARAQLLVLRGRTHRLHSAICCVEEGRPVWSHLASATLHVREFTDDFLDAYLAEEGVALLGCVGGYRLEGLGAQLFEAIEGDYFTVLGLPLLPLLAHLRARGRLAA